MKFRGGESQRSNNSFSLGYSEKVPNATGKLSYLKPNRDSMQKPIGGRQNHRVLSEVKPNRG
jgi:hypothetical protein